MTQGRSGGYGVVRPISSTVARKTGEISGWEVICLKRLNNTGVTPTYLSHEFEHVPVENNFYGTGTVDMEYLDPSEWQELDSYEGESKYIAPAFLKALRTLHLKGVTHFDLHGRNAFYRKAPKGGGYEIKIIDFGQSVVDYRHAFFEALYVLDSVFTGSLGSKHVVRYAQDISKGYASPYDLRSCLSPEAYAREEMSIITEEAKREVVIKERGLQRHWLVWTKKLYKAFGVR